MIDGNDVRRQDEQPGVDGQAFGQGAGIGAMLNEGGDRRQAELLIIRRPPRLSQRPQHGQTDQQDDDRRRQRPGPHVGLSGGLFGLGEGGLHAHTRGDPLAVWINQPWIRSIHLEKLHEIPQHPLALPGVAGVILNRILTDRLLPVRAENLGDVVPPGRNHHFKIVFRELEMILEPKKPVFETKGLVFAQPAGGKQGVARRGRRSGRLGRVRRRGQSGKIKRVVMPMKHHRGIGHSRNDRLGSAWKREGYRTPAQLWNGNGRIARIGAGLGIGINLCPRGVCQELGPQANTQDRAVGGDQCVSELQFPAPDREMFGVSHVAVMFMLTAKQHQDSDFIEIGRHLVSLVIAAGVERGSHNHGKLDVFAPVPRGRRVAG